MKLAPLAIPAAFLALTAQAHAICTPGTTVRCTLNGKVGTKTCLPSGLSFGPCEVSAEPPPDNGTATLKYSVLTVVYAPPGTKGATSSSSVSYGSQSTTGTTTTNSRSFKQDYSVTASVTGGFGCTGDKCTWGVGGGVSYEYSKNKTHSDAMDVKKSTSSTLAVNGPSTDGIDHQFDQIWLMLRPTVKVSIADEAIQWTFDNATDQAHNIPQYLYVRWLKDPSLLQQEAPGTLRDLQAAGITPEDLADILKSDPLAACAGPTTLPVRSLRARARAPLPLSCVPPAPAEPRFVSLRTTLPYQPPPQGQTVPVQTYGIDASTLDTHSDTTESSHKLGVTAEGSLSFLTVWKTSLETKDSWTWTDTNTTATSEGATQKMSLTMGGPAFGYTGPTNMAIYFDTLYQTFVFVPFEIPTGTLHGVVMSDTGRPIAGQEVNATVRGVEYRTYTDANGEYRFGSKFTGPIDLRVGAVAQRLRRLEPRKSIDFKL